MTTLTDSQAVKLAYAAGFRVGLGLAEIIAIAHAESGLDSAATNTEGNTPPSTDRGILMLNSFYHPEIPDSCAFDPACAFKAGFTVSNRGESFTAWSTFQEGRDKPFLPQVRAAIAALGVPYSTPVNTSQIAYPFAGSYAITQPFGPTSFAGEPPGFWFSDKSLDYYKASDPTFPSLTSQRVGHAHSGIDFSCPLGTALLAPAAGSVTFAGMDQTGYGNCVKIQHATGITTLYGHLSQIQCKVGDGLAKGKQFGLTGYSGNVYPQGPKGAHLHLSLIRNSDGHYVDPSPYLSTTPVKPPLPPKPENAVHWQQFSGKTMVGTTRLYAGPDNRFPVLGEINPGTQLTFSAWILGQPRLDFSVRAWDRRWFFVRSEQANGTGWVQSARVSGNPSGSSA